MPDFKELPHQSLSLLISSQPFMCFWYYAQCQFNIPLALLVPGTDQWPYRSAAQITKVECLCSLGQVCFGILWMFVIYNTSCNCYYRNKCAFENAGIMIKRIFNVYYVCLSDLFRRHIMAQFTSVCLSIGLFLTLMLPNLRSEMLPINL